MPELPEVETICRSLNPIFTGKILERTKVFNPNLRWKIDEADLVQLNDQMITAIKRRAKYLLFRFQSRTLLIHLGMSGRIKMASHKDEIEKHTHVVFYFNDNHALHYRDPRRFGFIESFDPFKPIPRLSSLGVEPLSDQFSLDTFKPFLKARRPIKNLIMDNHIVVGIGNIYANESLFLAGIRPDVPVSDLSERQINIVVEKVKKVLGAAIDAGGTTLRDYQNAKGEPGFFQLDLQVYGRENLSCTVCNASIRKKMLAGRSSFFCPSCQQ